jgi:hypothetical protein
MRTARYYRIRTMVRYAIWFPLGTWVALWMITEWAAIL